MGVNEHQNMVRRFHEVYKLPHADKPTSAIVRRALRCNLIYEELQELGEALACTRHWDSGNFIEGFGNVNMVEAADAIADLMYVVLGTAVELGINIEPIFEEVHRSNMSKLDEAGQPIFREDGKILKGPNYSPPDIAPLLIEQGWKL